MSSYDHRLYLANQSLTACRDRNQQLSTENKSLRTRNEQLEAEMDGEQARWQKAIYDLLCRLTKGIEHLNIDGAGCDSGDPLDFTLSEISQAIGAVIDQREQLEADCGVMRCTLEGYAECGDGCTCGDGWSHDAAREALQSTAGKALLDRLAEAEKDRARLDWLEQTNLAISQPSQGYRAWFLCDYSGNEDIAHEGSTLRQCIDAAQASRPDKEGKAQP